MTFYVRFGVAAAVAAIVLTALDAVIGPSVPWNATVRIALYALAALSASLAASQFGWWSERLGRGWSLFAVEFALLLINYIVRRTAPDQRLLLDATLIAANVSQLAAFLLMARVMTAAGFGHVFSPAKKMLLTVAALGVAVAICWPALVAVWNGEYGLASIVSALTDVLTFALVAPLALSALALRGGQTSWIYTYLALSVLGWMINTGADFFDGPAVRTARLAGVAIASLFAAAAAATQYTAARRAMRGTHA